jgi:two-component system, NarL family, nitrate/nitrite response regulator NarL
MLLNDLQPIRTFLVDDHQTVLWGLEQLVKSAAPKMAVVGTANNVVDMLAKIAQTKVDVILLDLELEGECSLDCLKQLGSQSTARVLAVTGVNDAETCRRAIMLGARGIVFKKQSPDLILRAIEKVGAGEIWLDRFNLAKVLTDFTSGKNTDPESEKIAKLTEKERQIVATVVKEKGARSKIVAEKLHISEHTLRNHMTAIYKKLEVDGRMELYLYATNSIENLGIS